MTAGSMEKIKSIRFDSEEKDYWIDLSNMESVLHEKEYSRVVLTRKDGRQTVMTFIDEESGRRVFGLIRESLCTA